MALIDGSEINVSITFIDALDSSTIDGNFMVENNNPDTDYTVAGTITVNGEDVTTWTATNVLPDSSVEMTFTISGVDESNPDVCVVADTKTSGGD